MITTAVILAAGRGSRLGAITDDKPKGFLEIDKIPIIERSIRKLISCGIDDIVIGTGYRSEMYDAVGLKYPFIRCIRSDRFASTGSMATLRVASPLVTGDFLLLESDLLYDVIALRVLVNSRFSNCILTSNPSGSMDEVFVETDEFQNLAALSKNSATLQRIDGELVGISRVSREGLTNLCNYFDEVSPEFPKLDYEHAFAGIRNKTPFHVEKIDDLAWCEIDDQNHLQRAISVIYPKVCRTEAVLNIKRNVLLNPGPATTTDSVKNAQVVPDICPREKEFGALIQWIREKLSDLASPGGQCVTTLFGGSGTAAIEAIIGSVVDDGYLLVVNNGAYGARMVEIASLHGLQHAVFNSDPYASIDIDALEKFIGDCSRTNKITHLAVVHHETTSGLLNDIGTIGALCAKHDMELLVDAISSFAAVPLDMIKMNVAHMASTSNKNLQGMPGVSFVISKTSAMDKVKTKKARSYYLDLYRQYDHLQSHHQTRFTPPVQTLYALRQALLETMLEGVDNRCARYKQSWEVLYNGLIDLGLTCPVAADCQSKLITAVNEPEHTGYSFAAMHDHMLDKGYTIYPGKTGKTFRIANIGAVNSEDLARFVGEFRVYIGQISAGKT